jgi:hypothetical protein
MADPGNDGALDESAVAAKATELDVTLEVARWILRGLLGKKPEPDSPSASGEVSCKIEADATKAEPLTGDPEWHNV